MNRTYKSMIASSIFSSLLVLPLSLMAADRDAQGSTHSTTTSQGKVTVRQDWTNPPTETKETYKKETWTNEKDVQQGHSPNDNPQNYSWGDRGLNPNLGNNPAYAQRSLQNANQGQGWSQQSAYSYQQGQNNLPRTWSGSAYYSSAPQHKNWYVRGNDYNNNGVVDPWEQRLAGGSAYTGGSVYSSYPGHTYYSSGADINGNGVVEPWERQSYSSGYYNFPSYSHYSSGYDYNQNDVVNPWEGRAYSGSYYSSSYDAPHYSYPNSYPSSSGFYDNNDAYPYSQYYDYGTDGGEYYHYR